MVGCTEQGAQLEEIEAIDSTETVDFGYDGGPTVFIARPEFMRTIFIDDGFLKICECVDANNQKSEDLEKIKFCSTYLQHRHNIFDDDSTGVSIENIEKKLLATYSKMNVGWEKKEFKFDGKLFNTSIVHMDSERYEKVDTVWVENPTTGELIQEICTYYGMKNKL